MEMLPRLSLIIRVLVLEVKEKTNKSNNFQFGFPVCFGIVMSVASLSVNM